VADEEEATVTRQDDLVGWWKMDENTGTNVEDTIDGKDITLDGTNTPAWATGKNGSGLDFDGTNDFATSSDGPTVAGDATIAFWFNQDTSFGNDKGFMGSKGYYTSGTPNSWSLRTRATGDIRIIMSDPQATGWLIGDWDTNLSIDTWYHLAFVLDTATPVVKLYVDGSVHGTTHDPEHASTGVKTFADVSNGLTIGAFHQGGAGPYNFWNGTLDDLRIYNVALGADDVDNIVNKNGSGLGDWP
jgi:hypothetical protein